MTTHKNHLRDTKHGGPTCQGGRSGGSLRGEHFTMKFAEFVQRADQCERCKASKLFSLLQRTAAKG
jgi:hypothetical protein